MTAPVKKQIQALFSALIFSAVATPVMSAETEMTSTNATLKGVITVSSSCSIQPVTVDFGEIMGNISLDKKIYKQQEIEFECQNIPGNSTVRLSNALLDSPGGTWFEEGYFYTMDTIQINGQNFAMYYGIKPKAGAEHSVLYESHFSSPSASQGYVFKADFMAHFPAIDQMITAISTSGSTSHTFQVTIPVEVSIIQ